jgi:hypothetical protein
MGKYVYEGKTVKMDSKAEEQINANLPPPGAARRDVMAERQDKLEQLAEEQAVDSGSINPKVLEPDREIQREIHFGGLEVTDQQAGFVYSWACTAANSIMVQRKKVEGWVVVSSREPEAKEYLKEDGTRRIGDTILMKITQEKYDALRKRDLEIRVRQQLGIASELETMGEKYRGKGLIAHTDQDKSPLLREIFSHKQAIQGVAGQMVDGMLRSGSVPGLPPGGRS